MKLRTQLSLSVGAAVALSMLLTLFLTWKRVNSIIFSSEEAHFNSVAQAVENSLESTFLEYLSFKIHIVMETKHMMRTSTIDARNDLNYLKHTYLPSPTRDSLSQLLLSNHEEDRILYNNSQHMRIRMCTVQDLVTYGLPDLGIGPNALSVKGQTFASMLTTLSSNGNFSLWPVRANDAERYLLFILPLDSSEKRRTDLNPADRLLISAIQSQAIFLRSEEILNERLEATRINFAKTKIGERGCILLCDETGSILSQKGVTGPLLPFLSALRDKAKHSSAGIIESVETRDGVFLCHLRWIKSYKWFFIMAAPIDEIIAPSSSLISILLAAGFAILICTLCCSIFVVVRALRPLAQLSNCTRELADLDNSTTAILSAMEKMPALRLNLASNNELGELSRSFVTMGQKLAANIRSSILAMTAQKRIEGELSAARDIQMGILPVLDGKPAPDGATIAAFLEPARQVGGDLYDCFTLDDGTRVLVIGDVSGKGVPAALFMTMSVTLIRFAMRAGLTPERAITKVNQLLEENNPGNMFVTLFLALYTPKTGQIRYTNGGHCLPLVVNEKGEIRTLSELSGPLVGAIPNVVYQAFDDVLAEGEFCFFYTDGLSEAMNSDKELFGEERVKRSLADHVHLPPGEMLQAIFSDICAFRKSEPQSDDITMLILRHNRPEEKQA